jgi:hypothetical protein
VEIGTPVIRDTSLAVNTSSIAVVMVVAFLSRCRNLLCAGSRGDE